MAIKNNYSGFVVAATGFDGDSDNDSEFGENLNRSIQKINRDYNISAGITNTYIDGYINQYGNSARFSTNEQRLVQNLIRESINVNGITVRYMPRTSEYTDGVWNERPESVFDSGYQADVLLAAASGFEGEGDILTQYGMEFREEVILNMAINRFTELDSDYRVVLKQRFTDSDNFAAAADSDSYQKLLTQYARTRPLEGDLIVIPFGRSAQNKDQYVPKVFEISRVSTFHDGAFYQLGDNYQYKLHCKLFELSGEDLNFNPTAVNYDNTGQAISTTDERVARAKDGIQFTDSETKAIDITDSELIFDSWASNTELEQRAEVQEVYDDQGVIRERPKNLTDDYTARAFNVPGIRNLDDI
jgi:hypothetical protein